MVIRDNPRLVLIMLVVVFFVVLAVSVAVAPFFSGQHGQVLQDGNIVSYRHIGYVHTTTPSSNVTGLVYGHGGCVFHIS